MRGERGFTLVELLVGMVAAITILTAIMGLVRVATSNQDRVAERVVANQRVRPVMTKLLDTLHSACIAPGISPIQAGSTGSQMVILSKTGSAVAPLPDRRVFTLSGSTLSEAVYPLVSGTIPNFVFAGSPSSTRTLLTGVSAGSVGGQSVPTFRYYAYNGDQVSTTPLSTPLSVLDAARTAHVSVSFAGAPANSVSGPEQKNAITVTDSANLRLESPSDLANEVNLPCT